MTPAPIPGREWWVADIGGALAIDAGIFELDGGTLTGVSSLTIGVGGVIDAANPTAAVIIDTGEPIVNEGTLEASAVET